MYHYLSSVLLFTLAVVGCTFIIATDHESLLCSAVMKTDYEQVMEIILDGQHTKDNSVNTICNTAGETPLMIASQGRNRDIVELLVNQGKADVNIQSTDTHETALMIASNKGNLGIVNLLLKRGKANANLQKQNGATALMLASFGGYVDIVKTLLNSNANTNIQDATGNSAILLASMKGYLNIVKVLITEGNADETIPNRQRKTAVQFAAQMGHVHVVEYLLDRLTLPISDETLPLYEAILEGHMDICELLLVKYNADGVSSMTPLATGMTLTPLQLASQEGHIDIVNMLLSNNYVTDKEINVQNSPQGYSALHFACEGGHDAVVRRLLQEYSVVDNINNQATDGTTALMLAVTKGSLNQVVALVSSHNANVNIQMFSSGRTALHFACSNGYERIVYFLLNEGGLKDVNIQDTLGWTALTFASANGFTSIVKILLEDRKGEIDVNSVANDGVSSLIMASMGENNAEIVKLLLDHGASPNAQKTSDGFSALMRASTLGHYDIVIQLLSHPEIDVNIRERDGWSALMFASHAGANEIVLALLEVEGIDVNIQDKSEGMTAIMFACQQKHRIVLDYLIEKGDANVLITSKGGWDTEFFCSQTRNGRVVKAMIQAQAAKNRQKKMGKWGKYKHTSEGQGGAGRRKGEL